MTEAEINEKAKEIYRRCFDDFYGYAGVLNGLVIAIRETAADHDAIIETCKSQLQEMADKYEKQKEINTELVDEIEELKKRVDNLYNSDCWASDQLTKAKEIIKAYYEDNFDQAEFFSLRKKAEQFLKYSEVEK
jgi:septal ring factor EnvC (AmiA/AmiB activator)